MKAYMDYVSIDVLQEAAGVLMQDSINTSDEIYKQWTTDETISLNQYLNYAISKNWIDTSKLSDYVSAEKYSDSAEIYQGTFNSFYKIIWFQMLISTNFSTNIL